MVYDLGHGGPFLIQEVEELKEVVRVAVFGWEGEFNVGDLVNNG